MCETLVLNQYDVEHQSKIAITLTQWFYRDYEAPFNHLLYIVIIIHRVQNLKGSVEKGDKSDFITFDTENWKRSSNYETRSYV